MKKTIARLLAAALGGGMAILATAAAFGQSQVTLTGVDYDIINGPKKACPEQVTFTGHLQVRLAPVSKALKVSYQWVRGDGTTISPSTTQLGPGERVVTYTWPISKSYNGSVQLKILSPSKQSARASFSINCSKTNE